MDYIEALTTGIKKIDAVFSNTNGQLMGETMAELTAVLVKSIRENGWFQRDIITGLMKSSLATDPNKPISVDEAKNLFFTHFKDRIKYKKFISKTDAKPMKISNADLDILWSSIYQHCTYNSRKELYDSIPEWDGIERIKVFMRDFFDCKDNPNFFLLFLTSVIGKIDDPTKNYCPFFFDFVGESKGTGKTSFFFHLLGRHAQIQAMTSRRDDFFVNCYDGNNIIVIDDECTWVGGKDFSKLSYDEFKQLITSPVDKFSRKFQQPETHDRAFIIVRTANEVHTVFTSNERRQIVFNIGLPEHTCRHWELGDDYMKQLLAEAKAYYELNGVYQMKDSDWVEVESQNMRNFNIETDDFDSIKTFAEFLKTAKLEDLDKYTVQIHGDSGYWFTWNTYKKYCDDNKLKHAGSRSFANQLMPLATYYPDLGKYTKEMRRVKDTATYVHAVRLVRPDLMTEEDLEDVPF